MDFITQAIEATKRGIAWSFNTSKAGTIAAGMTAGAGATMGAMGGMGVMGLMKGTGYMDYKMPGNALAWGFDISHVDAGGNSVLKGWGQELSMGPDGMSIKPGAQAAADFAQHGWSYKGLKGFAPKNLPGLGMNAFFTYQGYQEGGLSGAYDAMALNTAVEASLFRWSAGVGTAYHTGSGWVGKNTKLAGHPLKMGMANSLTRGLGAGISGYVGQQLGLATGIPMAGTVGATVGAYIGGAPIQALRANPMMVGGVMLGAGAGLVGYGAYSVIKAAGKAGYDHRQSRRGVNSDGDMGAFMTQNAMTMRERSVQAIAKSHLNARSALGQEANFMHSPRNYNSSYR